MLRQLLFLILFISTVNSEEFWTTAEIISVDWKDECLTTRACAKPRFQIFVNLVSANEHQQSSWPVHEELTGKKVSSHWSDGKADDVIVSAQVMGVDSEFSFPRVCDQTMGLRAFVTNPLNFDVIETPNPSEEVVEKTVKLIARCFNVTLLLRKYSTRCPWCYDEPKSEMFSMSMNKQPLIILGVIGLLIVVICSIVACIFSIIVCRRSEKETTSSSRPQSNLTTSTSLSTPERKTTVIIPDSRLYLSTPPSPPPFPSPMAPLPNYMTGTMIIHDDNYEHISPNSSIYNPVSDEDMV